jgi:hypothetical protein
MPAGVVSMALFVAPAGAFTGPGVKKECTAAGGSLSRPPLWWRQE